MQNPEMITFHCPSCGMKLQVPAQMAGVSGPCPECSATITAPTPGAPAAPVSTFPTAPVPQHAQQQPVPQGMPQGAAVQSAQAAQMAQPSRPAAPNPLQPNSTNQAREAMARQPDRQAAHAPPRERMMPRAEQPRPRARWMRVIFPLAFLIVATALVLAVLQAVGIFNVWDFNNNKGELISTKPNGERPGDTVGGTGRAGETKDGSGGGSRGGSADNPAAKTGTGEGATTPSVPVMKDTHEDGEFPELQLPPSPTDGPGTDTGKGSTDTTGGGAGIDTALDPPGEPAPPANPSDSPPIPSTADTTPAGTNEDSNPSSPPKAGFLANQNLKLFLDATTLDERMALMSKSKHSRETLMASCLAGPLKPVKSIRMVEMVPRMEDNMTQYLYFVSFEDPDEDQQRHRIVMQVVERPGIHPPRIHGDAFIEHYEKKFTRYAKHPNNEVTTFHCIAEARTADLARDIPKELKANMVRLVIKSHPSGASIFDAYLNKNSPLMEKIGSRKDFPYTEPRFCVLSFRWNTTDPNHPYIELNDIISQGWEH